MARRKLPSLKEIQKTNWKEAFLSLRFLPPFFSEIRKSSPLLFYANFLARIIDAFTPILSLWVGKLIIDEIILQAASEHSNYETLWTYIAMELGVVIVSDLLNRLINLSDALLGDLYSNDSSIKIIRKTEELNISQLEDPDLYDKLERARIQTNRRVSLMTNAFSQIQDFIGILSLVFALIYFEPWLIVLLLLSIIPSFLNELKYSNSRYSVAKSWTAERRELDYLRFIGANAKTAKEVKLFGLTDFIANRFRNLSDQYYDVNKTLAVNRTRRGAVFNLLGIFSYYAAYVLIIFRVLNGMITIGELTFLAGSFRRLKANMQSSLARLTRISESALQLGDYFEFLGIVGEPERDNIMVLPKKIKTGFELKEVSFSYPGAESLVLDKVSFKIRAGEKMAFVGENGAGKTTLIKLLLRFYEPNSGVILLDGIDIRRFNKAAYQQMFGVIFQDFVRYEFTLRENIAIGNISELENMEVIKSAASRSLADQVAAEMKNGYEQQLGKRFARGTDLSGGQWQKIALGRAYMKDAAIMILDEPTSALDARAEYEAFQRFIGLTKGKTSIIISHRFSTVRMADRIIVLKDGKILEKGTHEELMAEGQLYSDLFELQAAGYQ